MMMRASSASALTKVAWLEHPHLTLLLLTPLLWQICKMLKKTKTKTMMISEASRRPPQHLLCLMIKGKKYQLKLEGLALLCSVLFYPKNWIVQFCSAEFLSIFSLSCNSGPEDMLYCVNFGVQACNMFVDLNYACSCVLVISYHFNVLFMQICMCEYLKIIGVCFLVNMLSLEKPDVSVFMVLLIKPDDPVSQTGLFGFWRLSICFSKFYLLRSSHHVHHVIHVHTHTHNCCTYRMHRYRGSSLGFS
jgi:hypothetical protein